MGAVLDSGHSGLLAALQAIAALLLVGGLLWLGRRSLGALRAQRTATGSMRIEERLPLDLKSALVIVRVGDRRLLLATADAQPARLLAELSTAAAASGAQGEAT